MLKELMQLKHANGSKNINYLLIPVNVFDATPEGAEQFNKIFFYIKSQDLYPLERTPSGGIKNGPHRLRPAWDCRATKTCVEMTILFEGYAWRIQFRSKLPEKMSGRKAFSKFKRMLKAKGIDLEDYAISNGVEVKQQIEPPLIGAKMDLFYDFIFEGVNHIDFHSSYAGGLANTHEEFREVLTDIYNKRNENEEYKNILNFSIGFMQSINGCDAKWSHLSRDAILDNNNRVRNLTQVLEKKGRMVILYNTDGIWYKGVPFHGEGEGDGLGQWHNDHLNCKFRAKSAGAYEFIENNEYHAVVRGVPNDKKANWSWGSIYEKEAEPVKFYFDEDEGVIYNG